MKNRQLQQQQQMEAFPGYEASAKVEMWDEFNSLDDNPVFSAAESDVINLAASGSSEKAR